MAGMPVLWLKWLETKGFTLEEIGALFGDAIAIGHLGGNRDKDDMCDEPRRMRSRVVRCVRGGIGTDMYHVVVLSCVRLCGAC